MQPLDPHPLCPSRCSREYAGGDRHGRPTAYEPLSGTGLTQSPDQPFLFGEAEADEDDVRIRGSDPGSYLEDGCRVMFEAVRG
jgi:hypothetical protein